MIVFQIIFGILRFIVDILVFSPFLGLALIVGIAISAFLGLRYIEDRRIQKVQTAFKNRPKASTEELKRQRKEHDAAARRALESEWDGKISKASKKSSRAWKALQRNPQDSRRAAKYAQKEKEVIDLKARAERYGRIMHRRNSARLERHAKNPTPVPKKKSK